MAAAPIKVLGNALSPFTQRVLVVMMEKNVDYELHVLNRFEGDHTTPQHLALQPFGQTPVIQDGDFTLFESRAIARYIADKYEGQGPSLYGQTLRERALVEQWLAVEVEEFNKPTFTIVVQLVFGPKFMGTTPDESLISSSLVKLEKVLDVYEDRLSQTKFLAGDFLSIADLTHLPLLCLLVESAKKGDIVIRRKHVNSWYQNISSLPSWKKVMALSP